MKGQNNKFEHKKNPTVLSSVTSSESRDFSQKNLNVMNNTTINQDLFQYLPQYIDSRGRSEKRCRRCPSCNGKLTFQGGGNYIYNSCGCEYSDIYKAGKKILGGGYDTSEYKEKEQERKREQERVKREQLKGKLTADQLDKSIRSLAKNYGLKKVHREHLLNRGFSEDQIKEKLFFSINKGENDLPHSVPYNFPGVNNQGKLISFYSGIACVFIDCNGKALGWQVRNDDANSDRKYIWHGIDGGSKVKVSDTADELPVNVFLPAPDSKIDQNFDQKITTLLIGNDTNSPIFQRKKAALKYAVLTEGGPIKGNIPGYLYNIPVISAAGGLFSASPDQTERTIKQLGLTDVLIAIDGGDIINEHRRKHWKTQVKFLAGLGVKCHLLWYEQYTKSGLDIDEITPDKLLGNLKLLNINEWLDLYVFWQLQQYRQQFRSLSGQKIINQDQKFLDLSAEKENIAAALLVGIKAPMGTGKTKVNLSLIKEYFNNKKPPLVINLTYLNSLSRGFQGRSENLIQHLQDLDFIPGNTNLSFCHQSLPKFLHDRDELKGRRVLIDEVVSVVENILNGTNVTNRFLIFALLIELLRNAEKVILSDANLSDTEVKLIQYWMGIDYQQTFIVEKPPVSPDSPAINCPLIESPPDGKTFKIIISDTTYEKELIPGFTLQENRGKDSPGKLLAGITQLLENNQKAAVTSESQKDLETLEIMVKLIFGDSKKIVRIDSRTVRNADKNIELLTENFLKYPDQTIRDEKPDLLLISPLCGTGTDISIKGYFARQYHISRGVLNVNAAAQLLFRVRDTEVEKHIYFLRADRESEYYPSIDDIFASDARLEVLRGEDFRERVKNALSVFSDTTEDQVNHEKMINDQVQALICQYSYEYKLARQLDVLSQFEKNHIRELLPQFLRGKGYDVIDQSVTVSWDIDKEYSINKKQIKEKEAEDILEAGYIPSDTPADQLPGYDQVSFINKESRTEQKPDGVGILNHSYRQRLPGIEQTKYWDKDLIYTLHFADKKLIDRLSLYHLLTHPDRAKNLKQSRTTNYLNTAPDFIEFYDKFSPLIDTLKYLGIDQLLKRTAPYTGTDKQIKNICDKYTDKQSKKAKQARELLGINAENISNCQLIGSILNRIQVSTQGKTVSYTDKKTGKEKTYKEYSIVLPETPRYKKIKVTKKQIKELNKPQPKVVTDITSYLTPDLIGYFIPPASPIFSDFIPDQVSDPIPDLLACLDRKFDRYSDENFVIATAAAPVDQVLVETVNNSPVTAPAPADNAINLIPNIAPVPAPNIAPSVDIAPAVVSEGEKVQVTITPRDGHNTSFNPAPAPVVTPGIIQEKLNQLKPGDFVKFADGWDDLKYQIISISSKGVAKVKGLYGSCLNPTIDALIPC